MARAHFSFACVMLAVCIGVSVGDELGFPQSLSNVEGSKRRSVSGSYWEAAAASAQKRADEANDAPAFKKIPQRMPMLKSAAPASSAAPMYQQSISRSAVVGKPNDGREMTAFRNAIRKTVNTVRPVPQVVVERASVPTITVDTRTAESDEQKLALIDAELEQNIEALAQAANVSVDTIKAALGDKNNREQLQQAVAAVALLNGEPAVTTSTTTNRPLPVYKPEPVYNTINVDQKVGTKYVMNAPKEYYPANYDKNYDDGFKTKVEMPPTSFQCGNQKHFPGLYADVDLGCMVYHVCALTDDGLVQKSFLCPENTLFDQSVLKCNWSVYVDCAQSEKLYDSNIPVSKSYQLMKALAFFSAYKNANPGATTTA
ncbi:uncharacterized protein LOC132201453 isoform X2 [Neocloeon triangulifer]|uniref:uncharacterized protein LOC132201453 isoform X2 n=1 Tax=Neocloeon triangulifer TaxID=2078957 RepID=UPI00286F8428|nr:uncharacterized protein LOC132201453 isoform X2 [Neocloeon triangulifer]